MVFARLEALARARGRSRDDLPIEVILDTVVPLPEGLERMAATVASSPRLLLLDPLIRLHRADENSASEMSLILDGLRGLARSSKTAILLVHHTRKAGAGSGGLGLRGSSDLHAFRDSTCTCASSRRPHSQLKIEHRAAAAPAPMRLQLEVQETQASTARFVPAEHCHAGEDPTARLVLNLLGKSGSPLSSAALRDKLGVRNQTVAQALKLLRADRRIERVGRDGWRAVSS
jgi:hypothetical protein